MRCSTHAAVSACCPRGMVYVRWSGGDDGRRPQVTCDAPQRPLPKWLFGLLNPVVTGLLRSPLHGLISHILMVLSFTGRTSGKRYAVPVGYLQQDNRLYVSCLAGWWQNLPGAPITVRLRGQHRGGTAARIVDPDGITAVVQLLIATRGERVAQRIGLLAARADAEAGTMPRRPVFMHIDLAGPHQESASRAARRRAGYRPHPTSRHDWTRLFIAAHSYWHPRQICGRQ